MKMEKVIKMSSVYYLLCALIHVFFPDMFKWSEIIALLPPDKMPFISNPLYIMNWCMAVFWVVFGVITFFYSADLLKPGIGRAILSSLVVFWLIRMFILQPVYVGFQDPITWQMLAFFSVGLILTAGPLLHSMRKNR